MKPRRSTQLVPAVLAAWMMTVASLASAQDSLDRAREFYESAAYEEALQLLQSLNASPEAPTEVAAYKVFCLVALGRSDEATQVVEAIVGRDPLFRPSEAQASPRVRTFFDSIRRPLLPKHARVLYANAKTAFDRKDMREAASEFNRVLNLLDELGATGDQEGLSDLRTLAQSFRDLAQLAMATPGPTAPAASVAATAPDRDSVPRTQDPAALEGVAGAHATAAPPAETARGTRVYGPSDAGVTKPIAITRPLPSWQPRNAVEAKQTFSGTAEIEVDERGNVSSVVLRKPVHPAFDPLLTEAMRAWKFRPALKDGVAVKYRYWADIKLGGSSR
jgi:tetratricopeptide (TPR) repeat protein